MNKVMNSLIAMGLCMLANQAMANWQAGCAQMSTVLPQNCELMTQRVAELDQLKPPQPFFRTDASEIAPIQTSGGVGGVVTSQQQGGSQQSGSSQQGGSTWYGGG